MAEPVHQTPERDAYNTPKPAEGPGHRQTGVETAPPEMDVADPHPSEEGHPYDAPDPGGDTAPPTEVEKGRANIGPNPAVHDGEAPPRPKHSGT